MSTPGDPYGQDPYAQNQYDGPPSYPPAYPGYPTYPGGQYYPGQPAAPQGEMQDPDSALGIVGLVLTFACCGPVGLIVSWIALNKSKQRGYKNTVALVGAILGGVYSALLLAVGAFYLVVIIIALSADSSTSSLLGLLA